MCCSFSLITQTVGVYLVIIWKCIKSLTITQTKYISWPFLNIFGLREKTQLYLSIEIGRFNVRDCLGIADVVIIIPIIKLTHINVKWCV